jgi:transcriptional regulator with PAS, ATPase and Fis domain
VLRIATAGSLSHQLEEFSATELETPVEWTQLPSDDEELAKLDLVVCLLSDASAADELAEVEKQNSVVGPIVSFWKQAPRPDELDDAIQRSLSKIYGFVVGYYPEMHVACRWIRAVAHQMSAALDLRTLVTGETGTGKELVARAIHKLSRQPGKFVAVNCSAIPSTLLEAELFGYVEGAFTGAVKKRLGRFAVATGGTIFLDEVADLPAELQSKLLRALEERTFSPLGSDKEDRFDARVVSATNRRLDEAISRREFRPDLYFRLAQINIYLPPLRSRRRDLRLLVNHFFHDLPFRDELFIDDRELEKLSEQQWPGNIRELRAALERFALLRRTGIKPALEDWTPIVDVSTPTSAGRTLAELRDEFDRGVIEDILRRCEGDTARAAQELGISRKSIYNLIHRHNIQLDSLK